MISLEEYNLKYKEIKDKILMEIYDIKLNKKGKEDENIKKEKTKRRQSN